MKVLLCSWLLGACGRINYDALAAQTDAGNLLCADGILNQDEEETDCGGVCAACLPARSCADWLMRRPAALSGVYVVDVDGAAGPELPFSVYCEMRNDGGGWTLAAKIDGNTTTFTYDSGIWTNVNLLNEGSTDLSQTEAKFAAFTQLAFSALRVGMVRGAQTEWLVLEQSNDASYFGGASASPIASLSALFAETPADNASVNLGSSQPAQTTRQQWLGLVENGFLQTGCLRWGVNVSSSVSYRARLGVIADGSPDCANPDSVAGFGIGWDSMGGCSTFFFSTRTGNGARCTGAGNERDLRSFGYIMVR